MSRAGHQTVAAIFAAVVVLPTAAFAQSDSGPYVGFAAGAGLQNTQDVSDETATTSSSSQARFGTGFAGRLIAGYSIANVFRPELELGLQRKNGESGGINENAYTAIPDLWIDVIHQHGYFVDFGGGIGLLDVNLHRGGESDNTVSAAWQLGMGAGVDLTPNFSLSGEFRRLASFDKSAFNVATGEELRTRFATDAVLLELRYSFAGRTTENILDRWLR